jgi:dCMP deaminase
VIRLDWDETWMQVAEVIALRSRCTLRQVGAVIVDPHQRVVSTGYNGPPQGFPVKDGSTCSSWCPRAQTGEQTLGYGNCVSIHAEMNAIAFADRRSYEGGTLYVTSTICWDCAKVVANSGIARVLTGYDEERDGHRSPDDTFTFLSACGIQVVTV